MKKGQLDLTGSLPSRDVRSRSMRLPSLQQLHEMNERSGQGRRSASSILASREREKEGSRGSPLGCFDL